MSRCYGLIAYLVDILYSIDLLHPMDIPLSDNYFLIGLIVGVAGSNGSVGSGSKSNGSSKTPSSKTKEKSPPRRGEKGLGNLVNNAVVVSGEGRGERRDDASFASTVETADHHTLPAMS